jgi:integrase
MPRRKRIEGTRAPNNTGSIYKGTDGYWHGRVTMGVQDNGRPDRRHVMSKDEATVRRQVRKLETARDNGEVRKPGRVWTVGQWLTHWLENIVTPSVRPKTTARYRTDVKEYLIPGLGAHRITKLSPEHVEKFYAKLQDRKPPLSSSSIHHVHATLRTSLNEAVRRGHIAKNPVLIAKAPQLVEPEIVPLTVAEARCILDTAGNRRNGVRFALALAVGLRQGEAIGLKWSDLDPKAGTLTIRRALQRGTWRHGCDDPHACGSKYHKVNPCREGCKAHKRTCPPPCAADCTDHARHCPHRQAGGLIEVETKSRAGRRIVSVPAPLTEWLSRHREEQTAERAGQADGTAQDDGWMFAELHGKPIDPRRDYQEWRDLLSAAHVRAARLHDARHTAATILLVLKVPVRAVMDVMGWSEASMASRYMHVPDELKHEIAGQVAGLLWSSPVAAAPDDEEWVELTDDQQAAIRLIASALPRYWQRRFADLIDRGEDGTTAIPVPA